MIASLDPHDAVDDDPSVRTLREAIRGGSPPLHFSPVLNGESLFRAIRPVEGMDRAITEIATRERINKSRVHEYATELGLVRLRSLPQWNPLMEGFHAHLEGEMRRDRVSIAFLEDRPGFRWAHPSDPKFRLKIFMFPEVVTQIERTAEIIGVSKQQAVAICLLLGLADEDWAEFFQADLERLVQHLDRRLRVL